MHLVEITIDGEKYAVSNEFASSMQALCREADILTGLAYPDLTGAYPLYLSEVGSKVISVIKEYRTLTRKNLKESKIAIDKVRHNGQRVLLGKFSYHEGNQIANLFRQHGAGVEFPSALEMLAQVGE